MYDVELRTAHFPAQSDDVLRHTTIGGVLAEQAARSPDTVVLSEMQADGTIGREWTYGELLAEAESLARALATRFAPEEKVALWAPGVPEWVIFEFAAAFAGLVLVTVNPAYRERELAYVLEQSDAAGLFLVEEFRGNPMAELAEKVAPSFTGLREITLLTDRNTLYTGADEGADLPEVGPRSPAVVLYTSGTTGRPKGAVMSHLGITNNARMTFDRLRPPPGATLITQLPLFHIGGCVVAVLGAVQSGGRLVLGQQFDPDALLDAIERERIEVLSAVPTMLVGILEALAARPRDVSCVQRVLSGAAPVPPELVRRVWSLFGCGVQTIYGQTECSGVLTQTYVDDALEDTCETVGQPLPSVELSIRRTADNTLCDLEEVGEICARGEGLMLEYNRNPEAMAETVDADGWLHTGDLGAMDRRGYVRVTGRVKEMIIRGGENLYPTEIENVVLEYPDVAEVAVVGIPDDKWGEVVACFIRTASGAEVAPEALRAHCRERLSPQKTPVHWIFMKEWPMTASGKIQKFVLREQHGERLRMEGARAST